MQPWIVYAILSAISAAMVAVFGKIGVAGVDSTLATTIRAGIMAVMLFGASFALRKFELLSTINGKVLAFIILAGAAGALSWFFYFLALKTGPASSVAALDRLSVVFVLIFATLFLGEILTWKNALGAAFITAGAILMVLK